MFVKLKNLYFTYTANIWKSRYFTVNFQRDLKLSRNVHFDKVFLMFQFKALFLSQSAIAYDDFLQNNLNEIPYSTVNNLKTILKKEIISFKCFLTEQNTPKKLFFGKKMFKGSHLLMSSRRNFTFLCFEEHNFSEKLKFIYFGQILSKL